MTTRLSLYSIHWKRVPLERHFDDRNLTAVEITCLDEKGCTVRLTKLHEEWLGVLTDRIDSVVREMKTYLPGIRVRYDRLGSGGNGCERRLYKKVLPYFADRVKQGLGFDYEELPFYRVYVDRSCPTEEVGRFFRRYEIAYFRECDWHVRLHLDFCARQPSESASCGFYYQWYEVDTNRPMVLDAFSMLRDRDDLPNFTLGAFDIETVPRVGGGREEEDDANFFKRIPDGTNPSDRVVMASVVLWDGTGLLSEKVLYLNPLSSSSSLDLQQQQHRRYYEYDTETDLLNDLHYFLKDAHVLTGYNVDRFDLPCIFARLLFLGRWDLLSRYSSRTVGKNTITTFDDKIVLDLYQYFKNYSNYDLVGYKLDDVAKAKLGEEKGKMAVDSVGIHAWYENACTKEEFLELCRSGDAEWCHRMLYDLSDEKKKKKWRGRRVVSLEKFGTFRQYLDYCLRDSQVVHELFRKETVLGFLIARAQFAALDVVQALHYGNSRFLLEVFQTSGTLSGFFFNVDFFQDQSDHQKYASVMVEEKKSGSKKFQGALNYRCPDESFFENVAVLDFSSMYPTALMCSNLCYGTCDVLTFEEYQELSEECRARLTVVPYRRHAESEFEDRADPNDAFSYPEVDPARDRFVIVSCRDSEAFLPGLVRRFLKLRNEHDQTWKRTGDIWHYNAQLCIKILLNSLYGTMGAKTSTPLAYVPIAMSVTALARYQLLAAFRHVRDVMGYTVCYVDTDCLMVRGWPDDHCERLDDFFRSALPHVRVKFEKRMDRLVVVSKKRYFHYDGEKVVRKGFGKKTNGIVRFIMEKFMRGVLDLESERGDSSAGWSLWTDTLLEARYMCRDPRKYAVTRKARKLAEYKFANCAIVKMLKKYPEKQNDYVEYAFGRADVAANEETNWVMAVEDCQYVNFEKLFSDEKGRLLAVLDLGFWNAEKPSKERDAVLNTLRWTYFVRAELLHYSATGRRLSMLMEKGVKYTFRVNDHLPPQSEKRRKNNTDNNKKIKIN